MEKINEAKFNPLSDSELETIKGGISWNVWKRVPVEGDGCIEARYNWFGGHCTGDIRCD